MKTHGNKKLCSYAASAMLQEQWISRLLAPVNAGRCCVIMLMGLLALHLHLRLHPLQGSEPTQVCFCWLC